MKNTIFFFVCFILVSAFCEAQESVNVSISDKMEIEFSPQRDLYDLPISFYFDIKSFENKVISLYSDANKSILIYKGQFGSDISKFQRTDFYRLEVKEDSTISLNEKTIKIKDTLYFKIENGNFSKAIKFEMKKDEEEKPGVKSKLVSNYVPGSLVIDAITLRELKSLIDSEKSNPDERKLLRSILANYNIKHDTNFIENKYLNAALKGTYVKSDKGIRYGKDVEEFISTSTSYIGGLDVTNIADGFAKFIVKRTKQELSIAFFDKFKTEIKKYPDLQTLFPQTYRALNVIGEEIYMYQAYIQTLRESFEKDLATLPSNLPTIISNHEDFFNQMPELKAILQSGFYIAQQIQDHQHPGNIIETFPIENLQYPEIDPNILGSFQSLQLLSISLKSNTETDRYWAPYSIIKELYSKDDLILKIYLGLLEQQAKFNKIVFIDKNGNPDSLSRIIDNSYASISTDLPKYKTYFKNLVLKIQDAEIKLSDLNTIANDSLKLENYYSFITTSIDLMKYLTQIEKLPKFPTSLNIQEKTGIYFYVAQTSSDIVIDVNRRNYSSAIVNSLQLYDTIFTKNNIKTFGEKFFTLEEEKDRSSKIESFQKKCDSITKAIFKYGSFMATIAMAKNSDDVEAAIEAVALPTGSARIKRESLFNVSINSYCGLYGGYEQIKSIDPGWMTEKNSFANSYGVTAPIGISINWGARKWLYLPCKKDWHFSHTIFLSIVDIGALASFRFVEDSVSTVPNVQLEDIISPGIFYSMGIPKTPLSVNLGWQMGPLLREVGEQQNSYSESYSRYSISLCVDIPILNLYTKPND